MFNQNDRNAYLQRFSYRNWLRVVVIGFCVLTAGVLFLGAIMAHGQIDLADAPMFTKINPPPPNLMILLDDSGSMTFEILVKGAYDGEFPNPDYSPTQGFSYVFDNMGDGYNLSGSWRQMDEETRKYWRSQWHETNVVYYNPDVVYEPWPSYDGQTFLPADKDEPLIRPLLPLQKKNKLDLDEKSFTVDGVTVPWAHYFVSDTNGTPYLVILKGEVNDYYTFTTDGGTVPNDKITALMLVNPPDDIKKNGSDDRQNFANWFTYHRRREFVAKAAIARVIKELDSVRVGIMGINHTIIAPLEPVEAVIDGQFKDETDTLIATLYKYQSGGGTPLKEGLQDVGEYLKKNDGTLLGKKGDVPYPADGGACQQSFTIVVTDGYYSDTSYRSVGNADGDRDNEAWGGHKQPYMDDFSDTLADIAMYYYATDLSRTLDNQLPANKWDGAPHQHMVTFAVAFGVSGTLNPDDYEDDRTNPNYMKYISKKDEPREYGDYVVWPNVSGDRRPESIDDLWHATVNGRGVFVNAGEPQKLVEGLLHIIEDIKERQPTSGASVTINGDWLFSKIGPDMLIFQGSYSYLDNQWSGDVNAYSLDEDTGEVNFQPVVWSAAQKLQSIDWNDRKILTFDGDGSGQLFIDSDLTHDQKQKLGADAKKIVEFIRGKDPGSKDNRSNMLGDIVHSSPVFNDDVVYVGANDGMLHAFKASDGIEIFAYVPYLVFDHLGELADPGYEHRFYVDLTPTVQKGEKLLDNKEIQTILVGGLGKGGMGYFALDITDPQHMTQNQVLWEFPNANTSAADVADMGYSYSKPVVVRSYKQTGDGDNTWIVIFGNGYNSEKGNSVLFILDAKTGGLIRKIQAGIGPEPDNNNGLSSPIAIDVDFDDIVDFVYAGDLLGNLWKFDLTSDKATEWEVAYNNGADGVPLFSAADPNGNPQPITGKPDVMLHPEQHGLIVCFGTGKFLGEDDFSTIQIQTIYGIWDYGDRAFQPGFGWSTDDPKEYLGAFREPNKAAQLSNQPQNVKLLQQEASDVIVGSGEDQIIVRLLTNEKPMWRTTADPDGDKQLPNLSGAVVNDAGWYLDLDVYAGERVISDVLLRDGILIVIGFIPEQSFCGAGGESVFMELNAFTGGQLAGVQFDINDDGTIDEKDLVEIEVDGKKIWVPPSGLKLAGIIQPPAIIKLNEKTEKKYLSTSSGGIVEIIEKTAKTGIAYWMEILQ
jgi:type IV pilus assembly protein PilY1